MTDVSMEKRPRGPQTARSKAIAISSSYRKRFPYKEYGAAYYKRGSEPSLAAFGPSFKEANAVQKANRKGSGFVGRGRYGLLKKAGKWGARGIGAGIGYAMGGYEGARSGYNVGAKFSRMVGTGDYSTGAPVTNQIIAGGDAPLTVNATSDLSGDIILNHREFVQNVVISGTGGTNSGFANISFPINPGLQALFPWLSQVASNFTLYEFQGLIMEYKPTSGEQGSTSNALGKVIFATNYDPEADLFASSVQAENYDYAISTKPSMPMLHGIETKRSAMATNMQYIRTGEVTRDKIFTDVGLFQVMTEGIPLGGAGSVTAIVGELWATYKIRLSRANLFSSLLGGGIASDGFYMQASATNFCGNTASALAAKTYAQEYNPPLNSVLAATRKTNTIGGSILGSGVNLFYTFPTNIVAGTYTFIVDCLFPVQAKSITVGSLSNCSLITSGLYNGANFWSASSTVAESVCSASFTVQVSSPGNLLASVIINISSIINTQDTFVRVVESSTKFYTP